MAVSIPSSDFLAICLIFAEYDVDTSVAETIRRVNLYQEANDCKFGVYEGDFCTAFFRLAASTDVLPASDRWPERLAELLSRSPLRDWIPLILRFNEFATKDTDDYWTEDADFDEDSEYSYVAYNRPFRAFFTDPSNYSREAIRSFFVLHHVGYETLRKHFR